MASSKRSGLKNLFHLSSSHHVRGASRAVITMITRFPERLSQSHSREVAPPTIRLRELDHETVIADAFVWNQPAIASVREGNWRERRDSNQRPPACLMVREEDSQGSGFRLSHRSFLDLHFGVVYCSESDEE